MFHKLKKKFITLINDFLAFFFQDIEKNIFLTYFL